LSWLPPRPPAPRGSAPGLASDSLPLLLELPLPLLLLEEEEEELLPLPLPELLPLSLSLLDEEEEEEEESLSLPLLLLPLELLLPLSLLLLLLLELLLPLEGRCLRFFFLSPASSPCPLLAPFLAEGSLSRNSSGTSDASMKRARACRRQRGQGGSQAGRGEAAGT
jgi:hypothetical protein